MLLLKGVLGSLFIQANVRIAVYREKTSLKHWPILEVILVSAITAIISFLVSQESYFILAHCSNISYSSICLPGAIHEVRGRRRNSMPHVPNLTISLLTLRVQTSDLVANLFKDCDPNVDYYGLCR